MERQKAHGLTTDSTVNKRFRQLSRLVMSVFKSTSVKRTASALSLLVFTIALGEGISKLPAVSGQATSSQAQRRPIRGAGIF